MTATARIRCTIGLRITVGLLLAIAMAGAAHAAPKPDAEQIGAAITNYGNKWLADHAQAGHAVHWRTETDPQQARWEGDVYVCRFEGAVIPTAAGATQGTLFTGELRIHIDQNDGALRCDAPGAMQFGLPTGIAELRARFPEATTGTGGGGWTQLLHLKLTSQERPYDPENPLGPIQSGTFAVPGDGELRITYTYRIHDYAPLGGLGWDHGRGPTRYLPGSDGRSVRTPTVDPPPGGTVTCVDDQRRCGPMPAVSASLTPRGIPAGFANAIYGTQLADYQELTVEFRPDGGRPAPPTTPTPPPQTGGGPVAGLLTASGLPYTDAGDGDFAVPFDNDVTVYVQQYEETLRGYTPLGEMPGGNRANQGLWAIEALRLNYSDPLGRLSLYQSEGNTLDLYWECQAPMSVASGPYVKSIAQVGAKQVPRWQAVARNAEPEDISYLYPGGDDDALLAHLKALLRTAGLPFEESEHAAEVVYRNDVTVFFQVYNGTAWIYAYAGGMPGGTDAGRAEVAIEFLKRNWEDPVGRLSLDGDGDVVWECQVPMAYLTSDFLKSIGATAAGQVGAIIEQYGAVPFGG